MLKHQETEAVSQAVYSPSPPADVRVTPRELAHAAASLEARREAEHDRHANTLPLGEAVQQLGLNVTPEELLTEVQTLRAAEQAQKQQAMLRLRRRRLRLVVLSVLLLTVFAGMGASILSLRHSLQRALHPYTVLPVETLAQVPENRPVHADLNSLIDLAAGTATPDQVAVDTRTDAAAPPGAFNDEWSLIKSGGMTYVDVWTSADRALMLINNGGATAFSNRPPWLSASSLTLVRLPLYRFINTDRYTQSSAQYDSRGVEAGGIGVTESYALAGKDEAAKQLVTSALARAAPQITTDQFVDERTNTYDTDFSVGVENHVVSLSGFVASAALKRRAMDITARALLDMHLSYRVEDHTTVKSRYVPDGQ